MQNNNKEFATGIAAILREQLAVRDKKICEAFTKLDALRDSLQLRESTDAARVDVLRETLAELQNTVSALPNESAFAGEAKALHDKIVNVVGDITTQLKRNAAAMGTAIDERVAAAVVEQTENALTLQAEEHKATVNDLTARLIDALTRAATVKDGKHGEPGGKGDPGEKGEPGGFQVVKEYQPGEIYAAGSLVYCTRPHAKNWAIAEALRDTYDIPGDPDSEDWEARIYDGATGPGFVFRGRHVNGYRYRAGDVVMSELGSAWVRTFDGESAQIPGDGWALMVKQGAKGQRGEKGERGSPGKQGAGIADISLERNHFVILLDSGEVVTCALPDALAPPAEGPGTPLFRFLGLWSPTLEYRRGHVVSFAGGLYVADTDTRDAPVAGVADFGRATAWRVLMPMQGGGGAASGGGTLPPTDPGVPFPVWSATETYLAGNGSQFAGNFFVAINDHGPNANNPAINSADWTQINSSGGGGGLPPEAALGSIFIDRLDTSGFTRPHASGVAPIRDYTPPLIPGRRYQFSVLFMGQCGIEGRIWEIVDTTTNIPLTRFHFTGSVPAGQPLTVYFSVFVTAAPDTRTYQLRALTLPSDDTIFVMLRGGENPLHFEVIDLGLAP